MANISLRVDDEVKKQAEKVCERLGLSLSTAINIYLIKLGRERRIPFEVSVSSAFEDDKEMRDEQEK